MAVYLQVYDSRHLQADCKEPGSARNPSLSNRTLATFFYLLPRRVCETKVSSMAHAARLPRSIAAVGVTLYTSGFKSACSRPENGDLGGIWPPWPWTATLTFILMWASWGHDSYAYKVLRSEVRRCNNQLETDGHDRLYYRTRLTWQVTICWKWQQGIIINL